jgi:hypothetical protein
MDCPDNGMERRYWLAENSTKVVYGETEEEKITDIVRRLMQAQDDDASNRAQALQANRHPLPSATAEYDDIMALERTLNDNSKISSVLRSPWTMRCIIQLYRNKNHFSHAKFLSQRSLYNTMSGVTGGVSIITLASHIC